MDDLYRSNLEPFPYMKRRKIETTKPDETVSAKVSHGNGNISKENGSKRHLNPAWIEKNGAQFRFYFFWQIYFRTNANP